MTKDRQTIISTLCGDSCNFEYWDCHGRLNKKCRYDNHCDLNNLNDKQIEYVVSDIESDIYLNACPGSGKTEVVGIKCAYEMNLWDQRSSGMAILTFTNSAENELRERVSSYYRKQPGFPHFLGTFTSWLHGYIANPFLYLLTKHGNCGETDTNVHIIDTDCVSGFLNAFKTKYSYGETLRNISANTYRYNYKTKKFEYCEENRNRNKGLEFERCFNTISYMEKDLYKTKKRFWNAGYFLYEDVEVLTYTLLRDRQDVALLISKRFPFIIVDECQDLSYIQLLILGELNKHGTKLHFIGDLDQSIYGFRDIDPTDISNFIKNHHLSEKVLNENYRSNQSIVQATGMLINRSQPIEGIVPQVIDSPLIVILYKKGQEYKMIQKYLGLLAENKIEKENCRIIVRNNSLRSVLYGNKNINTGATPNLIEDYAHVIYLNKADNYTDFQEGIQLLSRAIQESFYPESTHDNKTKLYRPNELSESTWRNVILMVYKELLCNQEITNLNQTWGKWKDALKKQLKNIDIPVVHNRSMANLRLRKGIKDYIVSEAFKYQTNGIGESCIKAETIHSCKGMSLDSVLFVSSYKKNAEHSGNYWKEWFPLYSNNTISEANRLAYVAASRAKHMLVLGIPNPDSAQLSSDDINYFKICGFKVIDCS